MSVGSLEVFYQKISSMMFRVHGLRAKFSRSRMPKKLKVERVLSMTKCIWGFCKLGAEELLLKLFRG